MRFIVIILTCFLFLPLSGQRKWERMSGKFDKNYSRSNLEAALDDAFKLSGYSRENHDSTDRRSALSSYYVAKAYEGMGEPEKAKPFIKKAHALLLPNLAYDENILEVTRLFGRIETELGYHRAARVLLTSAMEISLDLYGQESKAYVQSLYEMARLEMAMARWDQMINLLVEALQIHERVFPLDQDYSLYANYLGLLFMNSGLMQEAVLYFNKSLSAYGPHGLKKDLTLANTHNNLGLIYYYQSEFEIAAQHYDKAAPIYRKLNGAYSENHMMLLSNVASLYMTWEKTDLMEDSYRALGEYLNMYADTVDLPLIQGLENMANFYAGTGKFAESEDFYVRAIKARLSMDPVDQQGLQRTIRSLVSVCEEFYEIEKALFYLKMAEDSPD